MYILIHVAVYFFKFITLIHLTFTVSTGPVVFPPPPTDGPMESSGVVVGASGYGFVPPNAPQSKTV